MKITNTKVCITAAFIPLVAAAFGPGLARRGSSSLELRAAVDDVPDIVKAYAKKVKPDDAVKNNPAIPDSVPSAEKVALPEINVEIPDPPVVQSALSDSMDAIRSSLPEVKDGSDQVTTQFKSFNFKSSSDQISAPFKPLNDFLRATQEAVQNSKASASVAHPVDHGNGGNVPTLAEFLQGGMAARRATYTETYDSPVPVGKAPSLVEYFASGFKSTAGGVGADTLAEAKANLALLVDNTFHLFSGNSKVPDNVSPGMATGLAVATFVVFAAAAKNNQNSLSPEVTATVEVDGSTSTLADLARDVKIMSRQIEHLTEEIKTLRAELKDAKLMLAEKDAHIGALEKELSTAMEIEVEEEPAVDVSVPYSAAAMLAYEASDKTVAFEEFEKVYVKEAVDLVKSKQKATTAPEPSPSPAPAAKKAPAKKQSPGPRGATAKNDGATAAKAKNDDTPAPKEEDDDTPAPKDKAKAKAKAKTKKVAKKVKVVTSTGAGDLASLSDSALSRKTVKELVNYLSDKGVETNGDDGKPMKKALLVEAVRSL